MSEGTLGVVGLGYVGLPLALAFAEAGMEVVGVDVDREKVEELRSGVSRLEDVSDERIAAQVETGRLRMMDDYAALGRAEAALICLPTPLDEHRAPDLSYVVSGAEAVAEHLAPGALVVLESTTYPGTTREVLLPIFERGGREVGRDFHLAFSPERVDPGNRHYTVENIPKVVGGVTDKCALRAEALYAAITPEVHRVSSPETAEFAKLLENIFRGVNIALINELAILCHRMGVDVWEVVDAARTKPFGFMPFYPGPGLGGHCIPIDPFYLSWRARSFDTNTEFIELAGRVNVSMPYYAVRRISAALNSHRKPVNGSRILLLGMSYKPNVGDLRESPSLKIMDLLSRDGADVVYHDPHVPHLEEQSLSSVPLTAEELSRADCAVICTDHDDVDPGLVVREAALVLDLRNAVRRRLGGELPENVKVL